MKKFVERCVERGHKRSIIEDLESQIKTFGRYGFNKSHSVDYSIISFQTAWLKAHYPAEFMAALLSSEIGDTDKVVSYINEAREMDIQVLPPSVNESGWKFTVTGERDIRFGLGAIRHVGRAAIDSIIAARDEEGGFDSLAEFCERIDLRVCNKRVFESLIAAGALDQLGGHRAQLNAGLETALSEALLRQAEKSAGQASLFGDATDDRPTTGAEELPDVPSWSESERLTKEKSVIGFFISGHPLERYREEVQLFSTRTTATLGTWSEHQVSVAAVVTSVKRRVSKKTGSEYARLTLEDFHGTAEALVFPESWSKLSNTIEADSSMLLTGSYSARDRGEDRAPFIVEEAEPLAGLRDSGAIGLEVLWRNGMTDGDEIARGLAALCSSHPGKAPIFVLWSDGDDAETRLKARNLRVDLSEPFLSAVRELVGADRIRLVNAR